MNMVPMFCLIYEVHWEYYVTDIDRMKCLRYSQNTSFINHWNMEGALTNLYGMTYNLAFA